ncbi:MAG: methyl-accepting chemotaxis protein [Thermodesulfovibrionales bacterium]|nr:methyl-accepting chemotaxis protein [Thermodesulfovibrionales bacterium]
MNSNKGSFLSSMNFGTKIIVVVVISFIVSYLINFLFIKKEIEENEMNNIIAKARAVTMQSENTRQFIANLRGQHRAFDDDKLLKDLKEKIAGAKTQDEIIQKARTADYYFTIPIVASWTVAKTDADKVGYQFRVPRVQARNKANEADAIEKEMLDKMSRDKLQELWIVDKEKNVLRYMRPITLTQECLLCHGTEKNYPEGKGFDPLGIKMEGWAAGEQRGAFEILADLRPMQAAITSTVLQTLALGTVIIVIIIVLIYTLVKQLAIKPVSNIKDALHSIANGDLTTRLETKNTDDIGQTIIQMNNMTESFNNMIKSVIASSRKVIESVEVLKSRSTQTTNGAREQSMQASQIATAAEEMSQTITDIARNASVASETSAEAMDTATKGKEVADGAVTTVNGVYTSTVELASMVDKLNNRVGEIGDIVTVIKDIADQTNLLALNAAIEAARAGEQGRGFAVVADEVRKLAERTIKATAEISEKINAVQVESEQTTKSMEEASEQVNRATNYIRELGEALNHIVESVLRVRDQITQIATAVDEQSAASEEVARNIEKTSAIAKNMENMAEEVMKEVNNLTRVSDDLKTSVSTFRIRD